jgi:hypothetical protein
MKALERYCKLENEVKSCSQLGKTPNMHSITGSKHDLHSRSASEYTRFFSPVLLV